MVDHLVERVAAHLGEAVADDLPGGAVHVRDVEPLVHQEQAGCGVLRHGQREPALVVEVGVQPQLLDRHRGELGERREDAFVVRVEVALDPIRHLDQPEVAALVPD